MAQRLGKREWLAIGLETLANQGVEAVRVEKIAAELLVTKGSFYWHFKDRGAYLLALLDAWKATATTAIIQEVEEQGGDARTRLRRLFDIAFNSDGRLDREIRAWAAKDRAASAVLEQIDGLRFAYLESLFQELGFAPVASSTRSKFVYDALIGHYTRGARSLHSQQLKIIFELMVCHGDQSVSDIGPNQA